MQDEKINPFLHNVVGAGADDFLKMLHFAKFQWLDSRYASSRLLTNK
jgi:hypothetical protein